MKAQTIKAALAAAWSALVLYLHHLAIPVIILLAVVIADYVTGMLNAYLKCELCSRKGFTGILKKLCYFIVVGVGCGADWLISVAANTFSFSYKLPFAVSTLVTVWLIINELISVLENLNNIGVPMPTFLTRLIERLRVSTEAAAEPQSAVAASQEAVNVDAPLDEASTETPSER